MTSTEIMIIAIAVFGSAVIKNGVGVGAGIFLLPFLALVLPPKVALGLGAPAMLISDLVGVRNYWGEWDRKELMILIPLAALGVFFGSFLIKVIPDILFKQGVSVFSLAFSTVHIVKMVAAHYAGPKKHDKSLVNKTTGGRGITVIFGFLGGVASTVAHAGGLAMSVYMLQKKSNPRVFVGTLVLFFALINLFKIISYSTIGIISCQVIVLVAFLSPVIIVGGIIGNSLNRRFSQEMFRFGVLILIFFIGCRLQMTG